MFGSVSLLSVHLVAFSLSVKCNCLFSHSHGLNVLSAALSTRIWSEIGLPRGGEKHFKKFKFSTDTAVVVVNYFVAMIM